MNTEKRDVTVNGETKQIQLEWGPRGIPEIMGNCWKFDDLVLWDLVSQKERSIYGIEERFCAN